MGSPLNDSHHLEIESLAQCITSLCYSREFGNLRSELEKLYLKAGTEKPGRQAFQDALYTLMVQEEIELLKAKAQE